MIEKMKYVNIMGNVEDFDRVIEKYISKYDIQLEYTPKELAETKGVFAFSTPNPYTAPLRKAEKVLEHTKINQSNVFEMPKEEAMAVIDKSYEAAISKDAELQGLNDKIESCSSFIKAFEPFNNIDCTIEDLMDTKFIKYRFGKMPIGSYKQFETFLFANTNILFVESKRIDDYMYGICFVTNNFIKEADSLMSSFHFERVHIPYEVNGVKLSGTMSMVYQDVVDRFEGFMALQKQMFKEQMEGESISQEELASAYCKIRDMQFYFETRKFAARTSKDFYIFVGWMIEKDALALEKELANDEKVVFTFDDGSEAKTSRPPTKLRNLKPFRPFELFVKMYGLPSYNEIDPTMFISLTYMLFFGAMFGDVGQGAVLSILGFILYKFLKQPLGSILFMIGLSSVFFGFMYGSVFGFEGIIDHIWIEPVKEINTILITAVALGISLILVAMMFNLVNSVRQKNLAKFMFSPNGVAGVVFYLSILSVVLMNVLGNKQFLSVAVVLACVSLAFIALREPISRKLEGKKDLVPGNFVLFLFETVIELFEVLLSYFANTVSFVRVGAFALSHAGIMGVVIMLSQTQHDTLNPVGIIIGNIIVIGLEGLVVGIQALRLDFYEMFSRFYEGGGREFTPYKTPKQI